MDLVCPACSTMDGPTALRLFWWLVGACVIAWAYIAHRAKRPTRLLPYDVDPYELATLRGGTDLALKAGLAGLVDRGLAESHHDAYQRVEDSQPGRDATYVERVLWDALATPLTYTELRLAPATQTLRDDLHRRADASPHAVTGWRATRWKVGLILLLPVLFGVYRIVLGLQRGKPVELMVLSVLLVTAATAFWMFALKVKQSRLDPRIALGVHDATVRTDLMKDPAERPSTREGLGMAGWPVALTIMAVASSQNLQSFYPPEVHDKMGPLLYTPPSSSNNAWGSCGGSSSCSSGSSCGGGGCGGCGSS